MKCNFLRCRNEVFVEGLNIGQFASFSSSNTRDSISGSGTLSIPLYTIAVDRTGTAPGENVPLTNRVRVGIDKAKLIPGATIQVYAWYEVAELGIYYERRLVFNGYIKKVTGAFPTIIEVEDMAFPLRFGRVGKDWNPNTTLTNILNEIIPISNAAFQEYRNKNNLTSEWTQLSVAESETATASFTMDVWRNISPYSALSRLMNLFKIYCTVYDDGQVYAGIGLGDTTTATIDLSTRLNVVGCDIVPQSSMFTDYYVQVNGLDRTGRKLTVELGDTQGEPVRLKFSPLNTAEGLQEVANSALQRLKGDRNKGTITTKLYPIVNLFDFCRFTHTLFPELSGNYYVIGTELQLGDDGYNQILTVTNEIFAF